MALSSSPEPIAGTGPVQQQDSKDVSPFEAAPPLVDVSSAPVAPIMGSKQRAPLAEGQAQRQRGFSLFNCCFGRSKPRNKHKAHHHDGSIKPGWYSTRLTLTTWSGRQQGQTKSCRGADQRSAVQTFAAGLGHTVSGSSLLPPWLISGSYCAANSPGMLPTQAATAAK